METGSIQDIPFYSNTLQENFELLIYTPANYTPLNKYNILIASDGKDYFQLGGISHIADELIGNYEIENLIIVGVPYKDALDRRRKYIPSGEQHEAYLKFLAHELVPFIDSEFSTTELGSSRGLIGDSMAATVSLLAAIKYPTIFGKVILQSPYVDESVLKAVEEAPTHESLAIYHTVGKQESEAVTFYKEVKDFLTPNRKLHQLLISKNYQHMFYDELDGNHTWKSWKPDLKRALCNTFGI
ncbi:alpha/beta hydrolase [Ureibacillus suwonensis]|uniref:Alpha/beta hydrolase n=1 Tax=Ureibacillus suwonensis TaxID=313007 RepID=A0ABW0REL5_9BACL